MGAASSAASSAACRSAGLPRADLGSREKTACGQLCSASNMAGYPICHIDQVYPIYQIRQIRQICHIFFAGPRDIESANTSAISFFFFPEKVVAAGLVADL